MSIQNPPIDSLSPFNVAKFTQYPTLTTSYLDSLFLSKKNSTISSSPSTTFNGLVTLNNLTYVSNIQPTDDIKYNLGNASNRFLETSTTTLYTNLISSSDTKKVEFGNDIELNYAYDINGVHNINVDNINNVNTANFLTVPFVVTVDAGNQTINNINELKATTIYTRSPVSPLNYSLLGYEACERMTGGLYSIPTGVAGSVIPFKGAISGNGASSLISNAGYDIIYVLALTVNLAQAIQISTVFGATTVGAITTTFLSADTFILTYKLSFNVITGGPTNASIIVYSTIDAIGNSTTVQQRSLGGVSALSGLTSTFTPTFNFTSNASGANWSASRRDYSFIRKY